MQTKKLVIGKWILLYLFIFITGCSVTHTVNTNMIANADKKTVEHAYFAKYFKTSDASNHLEENIDAYQTWYEEKRE